MKIVPVFLRYDYGIKSRGESLDVRGFYPALEQITKDVIPFWFDEYLSKKDELQRRIVQFIDEVKPDIVFFILMRDEFTFETLDYLKSKYITINWFCDDPWRFENFTKYYAPHFTYSITTDKFSLIKYNKIGYENVILSQWPSFGCNENIDFDVIRYKYDVSFIGSISSYRKWIIEKLLERGIKVECFGQGWENGRVSFEDMMQIFNTSKINLNISNSASYDIRCVFSSINSLKEFIRSEKKVEQIKARNFEIPAFGGFQLTNYALSLEDYLEIGNEVSIYTSFEDLLSQIEYFLGNESQRKEIMINGYKRAIEEHTYVKRLRKVFSRINEDSS